MSERNSGVGCLIFSIIGWGMPVIAHFNIVFSSISDAPEFEAELDAAFVVVCGGVGAVIHLINMIIAGVLFAEKTGYNKRYLPGLVSSGAYYVFLVIPYFFIAHWSFF